MKEDFLVYYPEAKGNVAMLTEACRKSYHFLGFTTDGALRSSIDVRKWKDDSSFHFLTSILTSILLFMLEVCMFIMSDLDVCAMK